MLRSLLGGCGYASTVNGRFLSRRRVAGGGDRHGYSEDLGAGHDAEVVDEPGDVYGGLAAMLTLTAPGEAAGLVWDRSRCAHGPGVRCDGREGLQGGRGGC